MRTVADRCVACGQEIETIWDAHPCGGDWLVHVEGLCPVLNDYHEPTNKLQLRMDGA